MPFRYAGVSAGARHRRFQLVVEEDQGQRAASHVQAGDQLTDLGIDDGVAGVAEQPGHGPPDHEQLLVLGGAEPVQDHPDPVASSAGASASTPSTSGRARSAAGAVRPRRSRARRGCPARRPSARRHGEQRRGRAGHRAAGERHAQGPGAVVGLPGDPLHLVEVVAGFGGGAGDLEHHEVPRDATPLLDLLSRGAGDVVGDEDDSGVDALGAQPLLSEREVHDVAGVVAGAEQQSGAGGGGPADRVGLLGGGRGEDVADHRPIGEAGSHDATERRIVPDPPPTTTATLPGVSLARTTPPATPSTRSP